MKEKERKYSLSKQKTKERKNERKMVRMNEKEILTV